MQTHFPARMRTALSAFCVFSMIGLMTPASAVAQQQYPAKPIRLVIGFAPGSATDGVARALAEPLAAVLGQPVVVENKPGAASTLATAMVAKAAPDGYTLTLGTNSGMATGPAGVVPSVNYDPLKDFTALGKVANVTFMLVGNAKLPPKSLGELVAYAKRTTDNLNCASGNTNGVVFCELLKQRTNDKLMGVPYRSTPQAMTDVIGGQVQLMFIDVPTGAPRVNEGQLHAYAVTSPTRSHMVPDVPTMAEAGLQNFPPNSGWWALYGPAGLPEPIATKITAALDQVLQRDDVKTRLRNLGVDVSTASPSEMREFLQSQLNDWRRFLKEFNIRPEG
ncbi:tripartite tricarboxylate transporter substrate binding protein [Alcaligenaceae bacterium]|nr:tripartite tricarboxylate transporter substrate binding protein [Alcaligenaceae bacterium]